MTSLEPASSNTCHRYEDSEDDVPPDSDESEDEEEEEEDNADEEEDGEQDSKGERAKIRLPNLGLAASLDSAAFSTTYWSYVTVNGDDASKKRKLEKSDETSASVKKAKSISGNEAESNGVVSLKESATESNETKFDIANDKEVAATTADKEQRKEEEAK